VDASKEAETTAASKRVSSPLVEVHELSVCGAAESSVEGGEVVEVEDVHLAAQPSHHLPLEDEVAIGAEGVHQAGSSGGRRVQWCLQSGSGGSASGSGDGGGDESSSQSCGGRLRDQDRVAEPFRAVSKAPHQL
jgi:hypothetical protein